MEWVLVAVAFAFMIFGYTLGRTEAAGGERKQVKNTNALAYWILAFVAVASAYMLGRTAAPEQRDVAIAYLCKEFIALKSDLHNWNRCISWERIDVPFTTPFDEERK